jgi:hypothetical protein
MAKNQHADTCVNERRKLRSNEIIAETARRVFPQKTALYLQQITGFPERTIDAWLTGNVKIPSDALAMLLRSEYGVQFLAAVMDGAKPRWWSRLAAYVKTIDATVQQRKLRRELREALREEIETSAAIARADALLIQDEDFYSANASAVHAMARVPNRSVAQAVKGRR